MRMFKANHVIIAGSVANVRLMTGQHGQYGSISIAVDDGYFKKGENNQDGVWVDRTHFVDVNVNANFLKKLKETPDKGDMLSIEGKLTMDKWNDKTSGQERTALKVTASDVVGYIPKAGVIAMKAACGNNNPSQNSGAGYNNQQNNQPQGGYQQPQNQQQNAGGFQQQNSGGFQPQNGNPNQGGYQQNGH